MVTDLEMLPDVEVAVMMAVPMLRVVARPLMFIVETAVFEDFQATCVVKS